MRILSFFAAGAAFAIAALATAPARAADLSSCGNIDVTVDAHCTVIAQGGCTVQCEPVSFRAACSAQLETSCDGQCTVQADVSCTGSCESTCQANCTNVTAPKLDCQADCEGSCDGDCSAKCQGSADGDNCMASCKACCSGHCSATCNATPPSADCTAKCKASCQGSCTGQANASCQISCQTNGYASCETQLSGGCKAQCSKPEGALFCDGQYVDTGDNLKNCVDALNDYLKQHVTVDASASGSASCDGGTCQAQGEADASVKTNGCSTTPGDAPLSGGGVVAGLAFAGAAVLRRKRRAS